jgi:hypothetical protein
MLEGKQVVLRWKVGYKVTGSNQALIKQVEEAVQYSC